MGLVTLRIAAAGGRVGPHAANALVAAGFTLLQRSPALVRALAGRRAAVVVETYAQRLVALAASEGRGAYIGDLDDARLQAHHIGAVFTVRGRSAAFEGRVRVLLDEVPAAATVVSADGAATRVDLGSHFGLALEAIADEPGRDEECVRFPDGTVLTHREVLASGDAGAARVVGASSAAGAARVVGASSAAGAAGAARAASAAGGRASSREVSPAVAFVRDFVAPLLAGRSLDAR